MQTILSSDKEIYLDNSATTPLDERVMEKMSEAMRIYGNPSSLHSAGLAAEKIVSHSRAEIFASLGVRGAKKENLIFTASGTEANNLALFGVAYAKSRRAKTKIITTDSEHPSISEPLKRLEADGFTVVRIPTVGGALDLGALEAALDKNVLMASFMLVNNETGALYDLKRAFAMIKRACPDAVTHVDAVQGFLKVKFTPAMLGADLVSISSHKIHGPKGVGALYIHPDIIRAKKIVPVTLGGGQESGFRSGTENTVGIAGFGEAARLGREDFDRNTAHIASLRESLIEKLSALEVRLNIPAVCAPHVVSVTLPNIKSETMLHFLSSKGIYVSSGSACSSHSAGASPTLLSYGLSSSDADCTIRVSLSRMNTPDDMETLANALCEGISTLVRIK